MPPSLDWTGLNAKQAGADQHQAKDADAAGDDWDENW